MEDSQSRTSRVFQELLDILARLRSADGCLWDRRQGKRDIGRYLIEEAYEVLDAIDRGTSEELKEELGDLLFQILFLARIAEEEGEFAIEGVLTGIAEKMIRRHPHVFGDRKVKDIEEIKANWEDIKQRVEGKSKDNVSIFDGISPALPALIRAQRMTEEAARVGFDWDSREGVILKIEEELAELKDALVSEERGRIEDEMGDILLSFVNLSRFVGVSAEEALRSSIGKFMHRFAYIEEKLRVQGKEPKGATLREMDDLWNEAKGIENLEIGHRSLTAEHNKHRIGESKPVRKKKK